jgi:hypothetical protein
MDDSVFGLPPKANGIEGKPTTINHARAMVAADRGGLLSHPVSRPKLNAYLYVC